MTKMTGKPTGIAVLVGIGFFAFTSITSADQIHDLSGNTKASGTDLKWYYFDKEGMMQTAWHQDINRQYYGMDEDGKMIHNITCTIQRRADLVSSDDAPCGVWQKDANGWRYLEEDKVSYPADTWRLIDGAWYHFDENGYRQTGWYIEEEESGTLKYYLKDTGKRACNETLQLDKENLYTFDANGVFIEITPIITEEKRKLEQMAAQIVEELVTEDMSKREKATAIYQWIQSHIGYIATSDKSDWVAEAIRGFETRRGDCFTYSAVARAMLDAAGIENMPVYPKEGYHVHYWNLVCVEGGWYHFDTTPRKSGSTFCIVTNAQYDALSGARYSTHYLENGMEYPEMATE